MDSPIKRFGDMRPEPLECDEKVNIEALLDLDVMFEDFQELTGAKGKFMWIVVADLKTKRKLGFSCGGKVVLEKLREAKVKRLLPLTGKIVKIKDYYDII